jgi:hypothetical protein
MDFHFGDDSRLYGTMLLCGLRVLLRPLIFP